MEQCLFILLFVTAVFPLVLTVPRKYYLIQQKKTWKDAQAYCQATHDGLAIIESNENRVELQNAAQGQGFSSTAWIGLFNDINSWRWSMGNGPLGQETLWVSGEPNNYAGIESCGFITSSGWNDMPCTFEFPFLCFDGTQTGDNRYRYITTDLSWYAAQTYCRKTYTDLASARDATEISVIQGLISGGTWFGLFRDTWKWVDEANFSTISWMYGKPDNALGDENCAYLDNGQAVDAQCSDMLPFYCSSVITGQQQIMRVKVRSNQDVNEPAVKAAIMEQIKQKLKDHEMGQNITVKWREQPDGLVFHKEDEKDEL